MTDKEIISVICQHLNDIPSEKFKQDIMNTEGRMTIYDVPVEERSKEFRKILEEVQESTDLTDERLKALHELRHGGRL